MTGPGELITPKESESALLPATDGGLQSEVGSWLQKHSVPVDGIDLSTPFSAEAAALIGALVANSKIVAGGEVIHGQHEMYAIKAKLFRHLVEEHGFRVLAIEDDALAAEAGNSYIGGHVSREAAAGPWL